jgi:hypothetical protein
MKKAMGFVAAGALLVSVSSVSAEEIKGQIAYVDRAQSTFTLEDGTVVALSRDQLFDFAPGNHVLATYEMKDGKKVVTTISRDRAFDIESPGE